VIFQDLTLKLAEALKLKPKVKVLVEQKKEAKRRSRENMKKIIFLCFIFLLVFSFNQTIYSQQKELLPEVEVPEGYVYYQYHYAYLDISLIYPEKWINYSSQERGILIDTPDSKGSI